MNRFRTLWIFLVLFLGETLAGSKRLVLNRESLFQGADNNKNICGKFNHLPKNSTDFSDFCYEKDLSYVIKVNINGTEMKLAININSPASWIFDKSANFYSTNFSKVDQPNMFGIDCEMDIVNCSQIKKPEPEYFSIIYPEHTLVGTPVKISGLRPILGQRKGETASDISRNDWYKINSVNKIKGKENIFRISGEIGLAFETEGDEAERPYLDMNKFSLFLGSDDGQHLYSSLIFGSNYDHLISSKSKGLSWIPAHKEKDLNRSYLLLKKVNVEIDYDPDEEENTEEVNNTKTNNSSKNNNDKAKPGQDLKKNKPVKETNSSNFMKTFLVADTSLIYLTKFMMNSVRKSLNSLPSKANCSILTKKGRILKCKSLRYPMHFSKMNFSFVFQGENKTELTFSLPSRSLIDNCSRNDAEIYECYLKLAEAEKNINFLGEPFLSYFITVFDKKYSQVGIAIAKNVGEDGPETKDENFFNRRKEIMQDVEYIFISIFGFIFLLVISICMNKSRIKNCIRKRKKKKTRINKKTQETEISQLGVSRDDSDVGQFVKNQDFSKDESIKM